MSWCFLVWLAVVTFTKAQTFPVALSNTEQDDLLGVHNYLRALVAAQDGVKDMTKFRWDETVEAYATAYATDNDCNYNDHNPAGTYGENLAWGSTMIGSVCAWFSERNYYNVDHERNQCCSGPGDFGGYGHYSALMRSATVDTGCAYCPNGHPIYGTSLDCNYSPGQGSGLTYAFDLDNPGGCTSDADCTLVSGHTFCDRTILSDGGLCSDTDPGNAAVGPLAPPVEPQVCLHLTISNAQDGSLNGDYSNTGSQINDEGKQYFTKDGDSIFLASYGGQWALTSAANGGFYYNRFFSLSCSEENLWDSVGSWNNDDTGASMVCTEFAETTDDTSESQTLRTSVYSLLGAFACLMYLLL